MSTAPENLALRRTRIAATAVDALITAALVIFLTLASGVFEVAAPYLENKLAIYVAALVVAGYVLLHGIPLWRSSQTIGKKLFKLQVVNHDTLAASSDRQVRAPLWRLALRASALLILVFVPVIGLWLQALHLLDGALLFTSSRRTLHDRISGTSVITIQS